MNYPAAERRGIIINPLTLGPFPPVGAREAVALVEYPAPLRGKDVRRTERGLPSQKATTLTPQQATRNSFD